MAIAQSRLTARGQISIPVEVRRKLGIGPESLVEWEERGAEIVVRRAGKHSSGDVHTVLFGDDKPTAPVAAKQGVRAYMRKKRARR